MSNKLMIPRKVTKNEQTTNEQIYERYLGEHLQTVSYLSLDKKKAKKSIIFNRLRAQNS